MASTHGNLVLPPSRPVAEGGTEDHRSRRAIAPPIASRLSESAFASGPPKVSSPRCSPDAYEPFGWAKTIGGFARPMLRGVKKLGFKCTLIIAGYNLIRLPN